MVTTGKTSGTHPAAGALISTGDWLRRSRGGLFAIALVVGAGSGLGAVGFRYLIYFFTWLATGHVQFGQQGRVPSGHFPWLGLGFFVVIPVVGGLLYGPLIFRFAREARGHGVPEVMIAVADNGGRIRPQVAGVKALASALCIGAGGSVGREGPIVQIGSAMASSVGQWIRMPENRLRVLVACGAAGGIAATFNAPITGVFFGVEIILRAFSIEAIFTVMLSAMVADVISRQFLGAAPFLSGFPPGIALDHARNYLLVALLAVIAALLGLGFKNVLYKTEDLCDRVWKHRPEWARPAVGGVALGLLLLAVPQMYGVGYPVMYKAVAGSYALWFLIVLAVTKMIATSLTIGIGGSGGVFAPSLFIGATAGMAFGVTANHALGPGAGQPALYAVVAMGAVFASAARAPLTSLASVVEMTGDFTLTLPVMLAVAIATLVSRSLSYGTIYTTKLLRRGTDIDRAPSADPFEKLTAADAMRPFRPPLTTQPPPQNQPAGPDQDKSRTKPGYPGRSPTNATFRFSSPTSPSPRRCANWSSTAATACRYSPPTDNNCRAGSPAKTCCKPSQTTSAPRRRPGCHRQRPPPGGRPTPCADPPARLPDRRGHHRRRLASRRPPARRDHLAAKLRAGIRPGQPHPPRRRPQRHPHPRRPHQPARPHPDQPRPTPTDRRNRQPIRYARFFDTPEPPRRRPPKSKYHPITQTNQGGCPQNIRRLRPSTHRGPVAGTWDDSSGCPPVGQTHYITESEGLVQSHGEPHRPAPLRRPRSLPRRRMPLARSRPRPVHDPPCHQRGQGRLGQHVVDAECLPPATSAPASRPSSASPKIGFGADGRMAT